jgi:hypothetical protein
MDDISDILMIQYQDGWMVFQVTIDSRLNLRLASVKTPCEFKSRYCSRTIIEDVLKYWHEEALNV